MVMLAWLVVLPAPLIAATQNGEQEVVLGQAKRLANGGVSLARGAQDFRNDKFGICRWIDNLSAANNYFIPDGDTAGWQSFITNGPEDVRIDRCCAAQTVYLTSSQGQSATDTLIHGRNRSGHALYSDIAQASFSLSRDDCTTHCDGTTTCNTSTWTETVRETFECRASGWQGLGITRTGSEPASNPPAYEACAPTTGPWSSGGWSACSASCGGGTQTRSVTCTYDSCTGAAPASSRSCNTDPCEVFAWVEGAWGSCSATCGGGTQTRSVTCQSYRGIVADSNCGGVKPAVSRSCNDGTCATSGAWTIGDFGACSATCGGGTKTRSVSCSFDTCTGAAPATSESCNTQPCVCETTVPWGPATCAQGGLSGSGAIYGTTTSNSCTGITTGAWTSAHGCCYPGQYTTSVFDVYGVSVNGCVTPPTSGAWTTGDWGACSATCGGGTQTRSVTCAFDSCIGAAPATSRSCNTQACPTSGPWTTGDWGSCSATCGGGMQTRAVTCTFDSCTGAMPAASQACNTSACAPVCDQDASDGLTAGQKYCSGVSSGGMSYLFCQGGALTGTASLTSIAAGSCASGALTPDSGTDTGSRADCPSSCAFGDTVFTPDCYEQIYWTCQ